MFRHSTGETGWAWTGQTGRPHLRQARRVDVYSCRERDPGAA